MSDIYHTTNPENGQNIEVEVDWLDKDAGIINIESIFDEELRQFISVPIKIERRIKEQILSDILAKKEDDN